MKVKSETMKLAGYAQVAAPGGGGSCERRHCLLLVHLLLSQALIGLSQEIKDFHWPAGICAFNSGVVKSKLSGWFCFCVSVFDSAVLQTPPLSNPLSPPKSFHEKLPDQNFCRGMWGIQSA